MPEDDDREPASSSPRRPKPPSRMSMQRPRRPRSRSNFLSKTAPFPSGCSGTSLRLDPRTYSAQGPALPRRAGTPAAETAHELENGRLWLSAALPASRADRPQRDRWGNPTYRSIHRSRKRRIEGRLNVLATPSQLCLGGIAHVLITETAGRWPSMVVSGRSPETACILPDDRAWASLQDRGASVALARAVIPGQFCYTGCTQVEIALKKYGVSISWQVTSTCTS
jgi:hypothetical protein